MSESRPSGKKSEKFFLKPPPERTPGQPYSYTETPRPRGEVRFILPGAKKKQAAQETTHFDSTNTPQPFLDPDVLERWRRERKE
ncbi:hypothetical protein VUR80DRAFT_9668 [Thermomyces stellatus]